MIDHEKKIPGRKELLTAGILAAAVLIAAGTASLRGGAGAEKAFSKLKEALGIGKLEAELILNDPKARPNEGNEKKILDFCDSIKDGLRG